MRHKVVYKPISIMLSALLVISAMVIAFGPISVRAVSSGQYGYISDSYVNLRSGAGTGNSVVTTMDKNTGFEFVDSQLYSSSWYKIRLLSNSKSGYVHKDYVKACSSDTGYVNDSDVNLRSGAGTNYSVVTTMSKNTKFAFISTSLYSSNWYNVLLSNGKMGYIYKTYATKNSSSSSSDDDDSSSDSSSSDTGYVNDSDVNLRSGAGTSYSVVTMMSKNTKFTFISTQLYNSNWYNIKLSNGKTGYIYKDYATKDSSSSGGSGSSSSSDTGYVNDSYVNLRSGAGTSYSVVTVMDKNTKFTFVSTSLYNSNWYKIKLNNGKEGYIYKDYATKDSKSSGGSGDSDSGGSGGSSGPFRITDTSETLYVGNQYVLYTSGATASSWSSSNTSVATVDDDGIVTAKGTGTATITAKSGSSKATSEITVKNGTYVNISRTSISDMRRGRSVLIKSSTVGVKWKSSSDDYATVDGGIVTGQQAGYATITAYTSTGAATCLIKMKGRDCVQFAYASPNSAALNSNVTFYAITDTDRTAVRFVVTNGSTSYTIQATEKIKDGDTYLWKGSHKLSKSGKWSIRAYSLFVGDDTYCSTAPYGEGEVFVTTSTDTTTTVCSERRASDDVIKLIANYEGFLPKLTPDSITSDPTVGYGKVIYEGEQFYNDLTKNQAYAYLVQTVNSGGFTSRNNSFLVNNGVKFNQQQFDALVCFSYNLGASIIYNDSDLQSVLLSTGSSGSVKAGGSGYVNDSYVNLRSGAGTGYSVLKTMDINTKFTFESASLYNSSWYKIKLSDGTVGYIYSSYASASGGNRDLDNVSKSSYLSNFLAYHHAAGSCYWGLLYRRIDEAEVFFYGDYTRDGSSNKYHFKYSCPRDWSISIS